MKSAPNARARFSCGKENNCLSEGLYTKERFCYDKENQQLQTKMSTENPGQTVVECGKAAGYIKMVGKKMYRVSKVLNNNGIIAINMEDDHISFAVGRIRNHEQISNPLTDDIKVLFYSEFKVAEVLKKILKERMDIEIDEHEVGYVALHIHSALGDEKVSVAMQTARTVRECIAMIEMATGRKIDVISLSYNRMMNHIKYMVARVSTGETLKLDMNEYIEEKYPESYRIAEDVCESLGKSLGKKLDPIEIGYLAMHIERTVEQ